LIENKKEVTQLAPDKKDDISTKTMVKDYIGGLLNKNRASIQENEVAYVKKGTAELQF